MKENEDYSKRIPQSQYELYEPSIEFKCKLAKWTMILKQGIERDNSIEPLLKKKYDLSLLIRATQYFDSKKFLDQAKKSTNTRNLSNQKIESRKNNQTNKTCVNNEGTNENLAFKENDYFNPYNVTMSNINQNIKCEEITLGTETNQDQTKRRGRRSKKIIKKMIRT